MQAGALGDPRRDVGALREPTVRPGGAKAAREHRRLTREPARGHDVLSPREDSGLDLGDHVARQPGARERDLVPHVTVVAALGMTSRAPEPAGERAIARAREEDPALGGDLVERVGRDRVRDEGHGGVVGERNGDDLERRLAVDVRDLLVWRQRDA
jgi:hypothetical protein